MLATIASVVPPLHTCVEGAPNIYRVELLDDTGAGRHLGSIKQVPEGCIKQFATKPCRAMSFYTGGGDGKKAALALNFNSDAWGACEQHLLADCPDVRRSSGIRQ